MVRADDRRLGEEAPARLDALVLRRRRGGGRSPPSRAPRTSTASTRSASTSTTRSAAVAPFFWLYKHYFRVEVFGIEKVPKGRVLLISNHSGQLPAGRGDDRRGDAHRGQPAPRHSLDGREVGAASLPFVSTFFARVGQIVGTPENCRRLLENDEAILVFPEGVKGISKLWHAALPAAGVRPGLHAPGARDQHAHRADRRDRRRGAGAGAGEREAGGEAARLSRLPDHAARGCRFRCRPSTASTSATRCSSPGGPTTRTPSWRRR